jgi:hypothetical protein
MNLKKSWISAHPLRRDWVHPGCCLGPFINKAIHTDDVLFVWTGEWIQKHPADFFGFKVNWWVSAIPMWVANYNPPLMSYFLAGVASLFGWNEIVLHLACLAVAFMAAMGIYSLAQMWCERPLLATVVAIFTPAFLVSSTTLMCDVLMLGFWIWALVLWERALANGAKPVAIRRSRSAGRPGRADQIQRHHLAAAVAHPEPAANPQVGVVVVGAGGAVD